jgi:hypothetical protein
MVGEGGGSRPVREERSANFDEFYSIGKDTNG